MRITKLEIKIYIDQRVSRSSDKESARELRARLNFLARNTRISCCNHTSSRKRPIIPDESVLSWLNSADMFASTDYLIAW